MFAKTYKEAQESRNPGSLVLLFSHPLCNIQSPYGWKIDRVTPHSAPESILILSSEPFSVTLHSSKVLLA